MSPKGFAVLTATTAICLGLAGWAVTSRDVPVQAAGQPEPMFAGLLDKLNDVQTVKVTGGSEKVTLKRAVDGKWVVEERGGYPADSKRVREVALGLANLKLVEAKTAKPDLLPRLDLADPDKPDAKAREIELLDKDGKQLAAAVVGKTKFGHYGGARSGVYVRRAGEQQAWLAAGQLDLPTGPMDIIPHEVIDISGEDVARVTIGADGPNPIVVSKADPKATTYDVKAPIPEGRKVDNDKAERVVSDLSALTMQDVKPAAELTVPADAPKARFETWDGVDVDARVVKTGEGDKAESWVVFAMAQGEPLTPQAPAAQPAAAPPAPDAAKPAEPPKEEAKADDATAKDAAQPEKKKSPAERVAELKSKLDGWAFKLPDYAAQRMTWKVDDLLAQPGDGTS
jgi:hypothetical protein